MQRSQDRTELLKSAPVKGALLKLGMPTLVGMSVSALYNVVDAFFVGQLGGSQMAAVSLFAPIATAMLGLALLFGGGAASYISRLLGAGRRKEADECATTSLTTSMVAALLLLVGFVVCMEPFLRGLGATDTMMPYAASYAVPFFIAMAFYAFNATANNLIVSEGATTVSMAAMLLGGISNIVLDPVMIFALGWGVAGAAVATLAGTLLTTCVYLSYFLRGKSSLALSPRNLRPRAEMYAQVLKIGVPNLTYQLLVSVALWLTNVFAASYGDAAVAALGIEARIMNLASMVAFGFVKGYQPFAGFNYGARQFGRVREATKTACVWETAFACVAAVLLIAFAEPLLSAFSQGNASIVAIGAIALFWNALSFSTFGVQAVYSAFFLALGKAKQGALIAVGRQGIFFIPALLIGSAAFGLPGIIAAQPIGDLLSFLLVLVLVAQSKGSLSESKTIAPESSEAAAQ
uniref:Multidrug export protein MepA n=1 Tax=Muribaculaceae bacterium Z82 TaxID=2304548 RepID=A0A7C9JDI6_9BACT